MIKIDRKQKTDICILVEGSYPYVVGGVSGWVHDLIQAHPDFTFSLVSIVPETLDLKPRYTLPSNLKHVQNVVLKNESGRHAPSPRDKKIISDFVAKQIKRFSQQQATLDDLKESISFLEKYGKRFDIREFLDTEEGWNCLVSVYEDLLPGNSFIDYFWSFRSLLTGFYSTLAADLPYAGMYHATCTGFAGLLGARAHLQTGNPLIVSEHGIYTNERRIEIASVDWLESQNIISQNLTIDKVDKGLRDLWLGMFISYSRICYQASSRIITLFKENQELQKEDGAITDKMQIIPNGINVDRFGAIMHTDAPHPPTIALIGRVVPIKDVKTFIRACVEIRKKLPDLRAWIIGPTDEDVDYAEECKELVEILELNDTVSFTGNVKVDEYLPETDVIALTSISEAQPLVILEAGAAGIPCVATNVGNCRELLYGTEVENPPLGQGGEIVAISNPSAVANALYDILTNREKYQRYSRVIRERVHLHYDRDLHNQSYEYLYSSLSGQQKESA